MQRFELYWRSASFLVFYSECCNVFPFSTFGNWFTLCFEKIKITNAVYATICSGYDHIVFKHLQWILPSSWHLNSVLMLCSLWSYWVCSFFFCFVLCRSYLKTACSFRSAWVCSRWRVICSALFLAKRKLLNCWKSSAGIWGRESYSTASSNCARTACRYTNSQSSKCYCCIQTVKAWATSTVFTPAISNNMHSLT